MQRNDMQSINNIVYHIYNIRDFRQMRVIVLNLFRTLIPNTCSSFMLAKETLDGPRLVDPICFPASFEALESVYMMMEDEDYSNWMLFNHKSMVVRASDLMAEEDRMKTLLYKKMYAPFGVHYSIDLSIVENNELLGTLSLYRSKEQGNFSEDEMFLLEIIGVHLNARFYYEHQKESKGPDTERDIALRISKRFGLTHREAEILELVFQDLNNEEITERLCISPGTLKKHLQNIYKKTEVSSRWELMGLRLLRN